MPKLEYLMTYRADLKPPVNVGAGPAGSRQIFDVTGGSLEGPRLKGRLQPSGADWMLMGPDGVGRLDVRGTFETDDGAHIYVQYHGVLVLNDKVAQALASGGELEYGDTYFFTAPRFETGDERYAWLNSIVTIGEGRLLPNAVEYRVYQVVSDRD
jgi:hypothetical protein